MILGSYSKIGIRRNGSYNSSSSSIRGFRINSKRFSVQRLRARFVYLFKILNRLKVSYGQAFQSLKRSIKRNTSSSSSRRRSLMVENEDNSYRTMRSSSYYYGRSNSFYSEAIADCLEFIKRSSVSEEDEEEEAKVLQSVP